MLHDFPFISDAEFSEACRQLEAQCHQFGSGAAERVDCVTSRGWASVKHFDASHGRSALRIIRTLALEKAEHEQSTPDDISEEDEEVLCWAGGSSENPSIEYNILLSPTYRVPALYFSVRNVPQESATILDWLYDNVVTENCKGPLRKTGVMGGISMTNHPITDMPAFFVHPCNTATALDTVAESKDLAAVEYLQLWLGIIGGSVGLNMPLEFARGVEGKCGGNAAGES